MKRCFVIQPFDNSKYDQRYKETFKPSIESAGYEVYRVDEDHSVTVPIQNIEQGIRDSTICFAEISTDNPNVWYELGYAFACRKRVVMVSCDEDRTGKLPFDIQHNRIIRYSTSSMSCYQILSESITKAIIAYDQTIETVETISSSAIAATDGLASHEIAMLILILENSITNDHPVYVNTLSDSMHNAGYTKVATNVAFRSLKAKGMINIIDIRDGYGDYMNDGCSLTPKGESWILSHEQLLNFRQSNVIENNNNDDIPF